MGPRLPPSSIYRQGAAIFSSLAARYKGRQGKGAEGTPMAPGSEAVETILIVDDEAPVRQTFHD